MKIVAALLVLAFVAIAHSKNIDHEDHSEVAPTYNYHALIGIPAAEKIHASESRRLGSRVIGGTPAEENAYPYFVGLRLHIARLGTSVCGGALISLRTVLTVANCWYDGVNRADNADVVAGTNKLYPTEEDELAQVDTTSDARLHNLYNARTGLNNIAVLHLHTYFVYTDAVRPVALYRAGLLPETHLGERGRFMGLGQQNNNVTIPAGQEVHSIDLIVQNNLNCLGVYSVDVLNYNLCVRGDGNRNVCNGDNGGPLVIQRNNVPTLIGLCSRTPAVCASQQPSVFVRITHYISWINQWL